MGPAPLGPTRAGPDLGGRALETLRNFVGGEHVEPAEGRTEPVIDPSTGAAFAEAPVSGPTDVDRAVRSAAEAFVGWKRTTPSERSLALLRIADALEDRADELVAAESRNTGKPIALTRHEEIPPMIDQIRFFAGAARVLEGRSAGEYMAGHTSYVRREPIGVCGAVTPWNYPMMMAVWKWAPALAAGNTMVLKPSDTTPVTTLLMAEIMSEHLPPGVLNVVCGDRDTGRALVEHPVPAMVSVTGSVRAGMEVAGSAAATLKRVHLELGGKAPVIVFDDADVASTAAGIAGAAYFNAGQDCTAATRVLAGPRVHGDLLDALVEQARGTSVGGPDNPEADFGPLNNANQLSRVKGFVERVPGHARVLAGGEQVGERGYCYAPTVVGGLRQDDEIIQQEVFGPVVTVTPFDADDEAVALANDTPFGLNAMVFTQDLSRAHRTSAALRAGTVWVNCFFVRDLRAPFGGVGDSGIGREGGNFSREFFTEPKAVVMQV